MNAGFHALSDEQWSFIVNLIELQLPLERGIPRSDLRKVWNSLLFVLTRGCRWIDLPEILVFSYHDLLPTAGSHTLAKEFRNGSLSSPGHP